MGNNSTKYAYHIEKTYDNKTYTNYWPAVEFHRTYCSNKKTAKKEFNRMINECSTGKYRLVRYNSIKSHGNIVGINGEPIIIDTHNCT